ncbi:MAG TPA: HD domain-containing phosphohydrolase [Pirellulales bacterium]|nr:HD domain-containing phosphohydrolase [Pirellulales bacterium]
MRRLVTYLGVGVAAQIVCIALGLWLHDRYILSAVHRAAEQNAATELAADSASLAASLRELDLTRDDDLQEAARRMRSAGLAEGDRLLLTDADWNIRLTPDGTKAGPLPEGDRLHPGPFPEGEGVAAGEKIDWVPRSFANLNPSIEPVEGVFKLGGQEHAGLAYRLARDDGYLIVSRPTERLTVGPAQFGDFLPLVGLMTFLWLSGLLSICTFLSGKRLHDELFGELERSEERAVRREQALLRTRDAVIFGLAKLAESRDNETGEHVERISLYCQRLAAAMRRRPEYRDVVTPAFVRLIEASSVLHDIGKVGIADAILHKPAALTSLERTEVQKHPVIGGECLAEIERRLGASNFLQMAREIALFHHERWDGKGYPAGLKGEDIPLAARIVAIADNYDALVSRRPYKEPYTHETSIDLIRNGSGTQFDPKLVEVFLEIEPEFRDIARQYAAAARAATRAGRETAAKHNEGVAALAVAT